MWILTLIIAVAFALLGVAGIITGTDDAWIAVIVGATWLKLASLEKAVGF